MKLVIFFTAFLIGSKLFAIGECQEAKTYLAENKDRILNHLDQGLENRYSVDLKMRADHIKNIIDAIERYISANINHRCRTELKRLKNIFDQWKEDFSGG